MFLFELNVSVHLLKFRETCCTVVAVCIMHTCTYGFKRYFHFTWNSTLLIKVWLDVIFKSLSCNQQVCFGFVCVVVVVWWFFFFLDNIYLPVSIHNLCSLWWVCVAADRQTVWPAPTPKQGRTWAVGTLNPSDLFISWHNIFLDGTIILYSGSTYIMSYIFWLCQ